MQTHVKVVTVLFFVFGALNLCGALFVSAILTFVTGVVGASGDPDAATGVAVLGIIRALATTYFLACAIPALLTGWGLLTYRSWSRIMALVLAAFSLIEIPLGTLFGIYVLWVFFNKETEAMFAAPAAPSTGS